MSAFASFASEVFDVETKASTLDESTARGFELELPEMCWPKPRSMTPTMTSHTASSKASCWDADKSMSWTNSRKISGSYFSAVCRGWGVGVASVCSVILGPFGPQTGSVFPPEISHRSSIGLLSYFRNFCVHSPVDLRDGSLWQKPKGYRAGRARVCGQ